MAKESYGSIHEPEKRRGHWRLGRSAQRGLCPRQQPEGEDPGAPVSDQSRSSEICGLPVFKSVKDLPEPVDLAIVFIPARSVPEVMEECGKKGISRIMIQSAGFAETGPQGLCPSRGLCPHGQEIRHACLGTQLHGPRQWADRPGGFFHETRYLARPSQARQGLPHCPERDALRRISCADFKRRVFRSEQSLFYWKPLRCQ